MPLDQFLQWSQTDIDVLVPLEASIGHSFDGELRLDTRSDNGEEHDEGIGSSLIDLIVNILLIEKIEEPQDSFECIFTHTDMSF
jgi:hypothetical protein